MLDKNSIVVFIILRTPTKKPLSGKVLTLFDFEATAFWG